MLRLLLGLLKGGVVGGGVGYGAYTLNMGGAMHWFTYGLIGALVGLLVGTPFWVHLKSQGGTIVTPILKGVFGYAIAVGLFALVAKAWGGFGLEISGEARQIYDWQHIMGAAIGGLYGAFVELDDAPDKDKKKAELSA